MRFPLRRLAAALFLVAACMAGAVDLSSIPKPSGYVSDLAHVLSASDKQELEDFCTQVDQQLGAQFAIVTINTLGDQPIEEFALDLARKWGVGPKQKNEGVLLLLVIQDHKQRIEVGRGVEPYITDADAGSTMRDMRTLLRENNYGGALMQGARALAARIAAGKNVAFSDAPALPQERPQPQRQERGSGFPIPLIIFGVIVLLFLLLSRRGGGRGGGGFGGGFLSGMLLNSLLNSGRERGSRWGDGGGFGGGSGGGGGFGGFGGGDFGGGGASSDW